MPYFLKRQNFFTRLSSLIAVRYLISFLAMVLSLHCFFGSRCYATSLFRIVLDGVFIEAGAQVTKHCFITKKLNLQLLIGVGWRYVFQNPVKTSSLFLNWKRQ